MKQWQIFLMAGLFLAVCNSLGDAEAAASHVTLQSDIYSTNVMEDDYIMAILTLNNTDTEFRKQEVYLVAVWPSGVAWTSSFSDTNEDNIEGDEISMVREGSATILFYVFCDGPCQAGDVNIVSIYASTDPRFYNDDGNVTDTCGSDDCETDTTPANQSANITNSISITLTARMAYHSVVNCDAESSEGGNEFSKGNTYLWHYTLTNTGWNTDTYQFTSTVTSADGHDVRYWWTGPGIPNGKELTGQSDSSSMAVHSAEGEISIGLATNATPGIYMVKLTVTSTNGGQDSWCAFDVVIPTEESIKVSVAKVDIPEHPEWEWNYSYQVEVSDLQLDVNYTAIIIVKRVGDDEWGGIDWWWYIDQESNSNPFALQRGCYHINANLYERETLQSDGDNATVLTAADLDFAVGTGKCIDGVYSEDEETIAGQCTCPDGSKGQMVGPADDDGVDDGCLCEDSEEDEEVVPSVSLISSIAAIGIIALRRRY